MVASVHCEVLAPASVVTALMHSLDQEYGADEWRLFIDSNKTSLNGVLLHNGKEKPSASEGYGTNAEKIIKQ